MTEVISAPRANNEEPVPAEARICNLVPSRDTERDWTFTDALSVGALGAVTALPNSVDLRRDWWTIGDQEDTGSCVGWATGDGLMRYHLVTASKLNSDRRVSPRFVWMASKETDAFFQRPETFIEGAGTELKSAVEVCKKYGVVEESLLPFHIQTKMYRGQENTFWAHAATLRIASYFNVGKNLNQWKTVLADGRPILAGFMVDDTWDNATANGGFLEDFAAGTERGGHAVAIVGYLPSGHFIVRNSWGTAWGDKGFAYASPKYIKGAFFPEAYVVSL
ncbi:C1 family peptidase [Nocardia amikacinitolerans]|uniref:C1 family peptidase n=1 Tax=Nocardia amikacinitolerans TaxID=756689 RepID=UPI0009FFB85E|nr:C1 family peptidase [Nocardia amikacinitolerans]MCP2298135.1 Papain family cysteine protease [Nocardia amikacinitolerans]MCP2315949.1 Papain family cysteine protease [Nocardia amikacinitolerans]